MGVSWGQAPQNMIGLYRLPDEESFMKESASGVVGFGTMVQKDNPVVCIKEVTLYGLGTAEKVPIWKSLRQ